MERSKVYKSKEEKLVTGVKQKKVILRCNKK